MTTSIPPTDRRRPAAGFTLTELIVSAALGGLLMTAVLSAFLFVSRTGLRANAYSELEGELRRALETFAQEARLAEDVRWHHAQCLTLHLPAGSPAPRVTYGYDTDPASPTYRAFYRVAGGSDSTAPRRALVHGVEPDFTFHRYKLEPAAGGDAATNDLETKQIQVTLRAVRAAGAAQETSSARFILRNKRSGA